MVVLAGAALGFVANLAYPKPPGALINVAIFLLFVGLFSFSAYQQRFVKGRVFGPLVYVTGAGEEFLESLVPENSVQVTSGTEE